MKTYTYEPTKHPRLFRVVDREGNWERYFLTDLVPEKGREISTMGGVYLRGVTTILDKGYAKGEGLLRFLSQHTESERDEILKSAGERGDKVHRAIAMLSEGLGTLNKTDGVYNREIKEYEPLSNEEWDCLLAFESFWRRHEPIVLQSEAPLYSLEGGYAGTADKIWILTKACDVKMCPCKDWINLIGLNDYKTSSGIYPSYWAQVGAYAKAENIKEYLPTGRVIDYTSILRLGTNHKTTGGYEFRVSNRLGAQYELFGAAKTIANYESNEFDPSKEVQEIPDSITIELKKMPESVETPKVEKKNGKGKRNQPKAGRSAKAKAGHAATSQK
ncbi:MAG: hypothetical protein M1361_01135 [Patescibacteria group bacterium]|nr:hypothetical protein [Patescibacteria group bacterium]MCL5224207.1 hypothetical protein [Patescibacteria group bacterium]